MDASYDFDSKRRVVIVTIRGKLTDQGLLEGYDRLTNDPRFDRNASQLVDLRAASGAEVTERGVRALVERPPEFAATSRRAIVVPSDLGFGMARMYELLRGGDAGEVRVFRDIDAAKEWLGV
jgi:hypothetical protein